MPIASTNQPTRPRADHLLIRSDEELVAVFAAVATVAGGCSLVGVELNAVHVDATASADTGQVFIFAQGENFIVLTIRRRCEAWPRVGWPFVSM